MESVIKVIKRNNNLTKMKWKHSTMLKIVNFNNQMREYTKLVSIFISCFEMFKNITENIAIMRASELEMNKKR